MTTQCQRTRNAQSKILMLLLYR